MVTSKLTAVFLRDVQYVSENSLNLWASAFEPIPFGRHF